MQTDAVSPFDKLRVRETASVCENHSLRRHDHLVEVNRGCTRADVELQQRRRVGVGGVKGVRPKRLRRGRQVDDRRSPVGRPGIIELLNGELHRPRGGGLAHERNRVRLARGDGQ